jgi:hypothetical protein
VSGEIAGVTVADVVEGQTEIVGGDVEGRAGPSSSS